MVLGSAAAIAGLTPVGALSAGAETIAVFTKSAGNPIARACARAPTRWQRRTG